MSEVPVIVMTGAFAHTMSIVLSVEVRIQCWFQNFIMSACRLQELILWFFLSWFSVDWRWKMSLYSRPPCTMVLPVFTRMWFLGDLGLTSDSASPERVRNSLPSCSIPFPFSFLVPALGWLGSLIQRDITWLLWDWVLTYLSCLSCWLCNNARSGKYRLYLLGRIAQECAAMKWNGQKWILFHVSELLPRRNYSNYPHWSNLQRFISYSCWNQMQFWDRI